MNDDFELNIDLPAQLPMQSDGNFFIQPLPESWREILEEKLPIVVDILDNSQSWLAGGLLRTLISNEPLSPKTTDIDLFFMDETIFEAVKSHLDAMDGMKRVFQCPENKLTTFMDTHTDWKYQCIAMDFYGSTLEVVSSFDFTTCCIGTNGTDFVFHRDAIMDTMNKNLRWNKITHPASSLRRMMKYARKGFTMAESEYQYFVECVENHHPDIQDSKLVYID